MDLISWWHPTAKKPCCASCGECKQCGKSLEGGGYQWRKKKFCSETCVRAAGYRDNPEPANTSELIKMKEHLSTHRVPYSTAVELDGRIRNGANVNFSLTDMVAKGAAKRLRTWLTPAEMWLLINSKKQDAFHNEVLRALNEAMNDVGLFQKGAHLLWDKPDALRWVAAGVRMRKNHYWIDRSNPYRPTMPRYAVYQGKKVLRRFHDERNAILFAEKHRAFVFDNVRGQDVAFG